MSKLITPLLIFCIMIKVSWATGPEKLPLSLTAKMTSPAGLEQVSLVFKENKAMIIMNSNFLNLESWPVLLGVFEKDLDETLKMTQTILAADYGNSKDLLRYSEGDSSPHRLQILLGDNEIPSESKSYERLKNTLVRVMSDLSSWKATKGAKISELKDGSLSYELLEKSPSTTQIQKCPKRGACEIPGQGLIWKNVNREKRP